MESEYVISAPQSAPEWLSALDESDGGDLRYKRSAEIRELTNACNISAGIQQTNSHPL